MPRPKLTIPTEEQKVHIPVDVLADVRLLLHDPVRNKTSFGAISKLVTELLRAWVAKQRRELAKTEQNGDNIHPETVPNIQGDPNV